MSITETYWVKSEQDFQKLMQSVDEELFKKGMPIYIRPIEASSLISARFGLTIISLPFKQVATEGSYIGSDLCIRIKQWFTDKYGEKLKIDPTWKMAILIRGDAFRVRLPLIAGTPKIDIFDLVDDLTETYRKSLNQEEINLIITQFNIGQRAKCELDSLINNTLIKQAKGDIEASVYHLFTTPPQYGLSKWASLQATEKVIKTFIQEKVGSYKYGHDLDKQAEDAQSVGLNPISRNNLTSIQCLSGVRYGKIVVNLVEAIQAHQASLEVCLEVAKQISIAKRAKANIQLSPNKFYVDASDRLVRCISVDMEKVVMMHFNATSPNPETEYTVDKDSWAEYVGVDISSITQPFEERYQELLKIKADKREEAIRKLVPYKK
ncbi:MAG: hypothetical protein M3388_02305 [Acidobacteriota bacterium]|nr:hypothetical protein [Acidobacteriota bacterium]